MGTTITKAFGTAERFLAASGGSRIVSQYKPIANKASAANGGAYSTPDLVKSYLNKASVGKGRDFLNHGPNNIDYLDVPNGGIYKPTDVGLWGGKFARVLYVQKGTTEKAAVASATSGEWWMSMETLREIGSYSNGSRDFLENMRYALALGFRLDLDTTRIAVATIHGPTGAYAGRGKPTSEGYKAAEFPTINGNPTLVQLFIPGLKDQANSVNPDVVDSVFDVRETNIYDIVGAYVKYGNGRATSGAS